MENSKAIIVTGMHRSGTSLTASLAVSLGINMGQDFLSPDQNNRRGYFEDIDFLSFQRDILSQSCPSDDGGHPDWGWTEGENLNQANFYKFLPKAKAMVSSRKKKKELWGWKDPRTTLFVDFWDKALENPFYIFVYRFPWEVADSLQRLAAPVFLRNPGYAYLIWTFYNRHLLDFYNRNPKRCLLLSINALRQNPNRLAEFLRVKFNLSLKNANLNSIYESELFTSGEISDPLIDLTAATSPECVEMLKRLDDAADLSGKALWQAQPLHSKFKVGKKSLPVDVSIIVTCYDDGSFLIEAIASFERTAPQNCEIIIVNDGSKDPRTLEILKVLADAGYFIVNQKNQGLSSARNAGIRLARGRYILPFDADNRLRAGFIESAVKVLDSSPETGVVYGYRQLFGMKNAVEEVAGFDLEKLLEFNYIDACAVMRKRVWEDCGGYDERVTPCEDWELWINAAKRGWQFYRLSEIAFDYRVRPESLISKTENAEFLDRILEQMMIKHYDLYQSRLIPQLAIMKRNCVHLTVSVRRLTEENERQRSENEFLWREFSIVSPGTCEKMRRRLFLQNPHVSQTENLRGSELLYYARRAKQAVARLVKFGRKRLSPKF